MFEQKSYTIRRHLLQGGLWVDSRTQQAFLSFLPTEPTSAGTQTLSLPKEAQRVGEISTYTVWQVAHRPFIPFGLIRLWRSPWEKGSKGSGVLGRLRGGFFCPRPLGSQQDHEAPSLGSPNAQGHLSDWHRLPEQEMSLASSALNPGHLPSYASGGEEG